MERITEVALKSVLTVADSRLQMRLPNEALAALGIMLRKAQRRWPNQDTEESIEEYLADFEQLAVKYSIQKVAAALDRLRIAARGNFFPSPNEVSEEIEAVRHLGNYEADNAAGARRRIQEARDRERSLDFKAGWITSGLTLGAYIAKLDAEDAA